MTHRAEDCNKEYTCTLFTHLLPHAPLSLPALLRDAQVSKRPSNVRCTKTHARLPAILRDNANVDSAGVTLPAPSPTPYIRGLPWYLPESLLLRDARPGRGRRSNVRQKYVHAVTVSSSGRGRTAMELVRVPARASDVDVVVSSSCPRSPRRFLPHSPSTPNMPPCSQSTESGVSVAVLPWGARSSYA